MQVGGPTKPFEPAGRVPVPKPHPFKGGGRLAPPAEEKSYCALVAAAMLSRYEKRFTPSDRPIIGKSPTSRLARTFEKKYNIIIDIFAPSNVRTSRRATGRGEAHPTYVGKVTLV